MYKKRILFINERDLGKTVSGASVRSIMLLKSLTQCGEVDVISFSKYSQIAVEGINVIYNQKVPDSNLKLFKRAINQITFWNPYCYYSKNNNMECIIDSYINRNNYDYIVTRYLNNACKFGILKYGKKVLIDLDDDPSENMRVRAKGEKSFLRKIYLFTASYLLPCALKQVEKKVFHLFYSNRQNVHGLNSSYLPNVTLQKDTLPLADFSKIPPRIMMVGSYSYSPNYYGLKNFVRDIFPLIQKEIPNIEFWVVGRTNDNVIKEFASVPGIKIKGFVQNISEEYSQVRAVVAPIYSGAGTSIKVIEAMYMNRACATTNSGARGLSKSILNGENIMIADDNEQFAKNVVQLILNQDLNHRIARGGIKIVEKDYSQQGFIERVMTVLK